MVAAPKNERKLKNTKPIQIIYRLPIYKLTVLSLHINFAGI